MRSIGTRALEKTSVRRGLAGFCLATLFAAFVASCGGGGQEEQAVEFPDSPLHDTKEPVWVRHILIQYAGAMGASPENKLRRAQADSLARAIRQRALDGDDFRALAKEFSDDASADDGGEIAALRPGDAPPIFEETAVALAPGEISEVVESSFGFHVIQRRRVELMWAQHILIAYQGAANSPDSLTRTKDEALALAERVLAEVRHPDASFPVAASLYSDDSVSAPRGGWLGGFGRGKMTANFERAAFALEPFEISEIVETEFGFHIIRRVPNETIRVNHILIVHSGIQGQIESGSRSREEALNLALDVAFRAQQGEDFAALANEFSDDRRTSENGGRLSPVRRGIMVPPFEDAAFNLEVGEVSDVVETHFGFHVIQRTQ